MRGFGLQRRFAVLNIILFSVVCLLIYLFWIALMPRVVHRLGMNYTTRTVNWQIEKTEALIDREVTLARKMADSPLLQQWCRNENNPALKQQAISELHSYQNLFRDQSYFFIIDRSRHYYFSDMRRQHAGDKPKYTLNPALPADKWYFAAVHSAPDCTLNVDHSLHLNITKVWINVVIKHHQQILGMAGTGIDLTDFLNTLIVTHDTAVTTILFDRQGMITGHRNPRYLPSTVSGYNPSPTSINHLLGTKADSTRLKQLMTMAMQHPRIPYTCNLTVEHKPYLAALAYMPGIGWYDLVLIDTTSLVNTRQFLPVLGIMTCALFVLVLGISLIVHRLVLIPLAHLTTSTQDIARGHYDVSIPATRSDEIGLLTSAFNDMSSTIKQHTDHLESMVVERTAKLQQAYDLLAEQNTKITDSITYATVIQRGVLPPAKLLDSYFAEHFAIWKPRDTVGGDAYFAHEVGNKLIIALVDCTGHGVPGALMTMSASALLQYHLADPNCRDNPAALLCALNSSIRNMLGQDIREQSIPTGMEMGICCYDPEQRQLIFAGARISLWYDDGNKRCEIPGDKKSLGYGESPAAMQFTNHTLKIHDTLRCYLTTDGWLDQSGHQTAGRGFGRVGFTHMLEMAHHLPLAEQANHFAATLQQFQGEEPQRDDITLVGFTVTEQRHTRYAMETHSQDSRKGQEQ
ncbi:MAG TPA: SpoIIE family protein phosphatase [Armatimonadota bacterium]|nr:SpoIIE family protein phosphatase [Armatimonadota bacterium]